MNNAGLRVKNLLNEKGQATLIVVLSLLGTASVLVMMVGTLSYNEIKKLNNIVRSSQSYYVAEAGIEDALLRLQNHLTTTPTYNLSVGGDSTNIEISGTAKAPIITSKGNVDNRIRKLRVSLQATSGTAHVAFNYGVQVGYGGLVMENNAGIIGNIYSNASITGSNNAYITGTAIAATGTSLIADQENTNPATPPNSITFGKLDSAQDAAQSFQVGTANTINKISLYIKKYSSSNPSDITVTIRNNSSGAPGGLTLASGTLAAGSVGTADYSWLDVALSPNPQLTPGVTYWLMLDTSTNSSRYYIWGANTGYGSGEAKTHNASSGAWSATALDGYFKIFLGGLTTVIDNIQITGDAWANTINNSFVTGVKYCKVTNNSPDCNTSKILDPSPENLPISDANISEWKTQATVGGVTSGNYSPSGGSSSLGPKEITGNLSVPGGHILTLTGTVWVHGTITIGLGAQVRLDSGYGTDGGVIISDGYILVENNVQFFSSGQSGSYVLLATTNDCNGIGSPTGLPCTTGNSALWVSNNAGTVILYTHNGQLGINNNAGAKEATGYKLFLSQNATVTYETGLANANFSSGPGGGYAVKKWEEIE